MLEQRQPNNFNDLDFEIPKHAERRLWKVASWGLGGRGWSDYKMELPLFPIWLL